VTAKRVIVALAIAALLGGGAAFAQDMLFGNRDPGTPLPDVQGNTEYDGRFVFVRLRYGSSLGDYGYGRYSGWVHDYPRADVHLMKILKELTFMAPRMDGSNIFSLDDPQLASFPVAYMSEPGGWLPSEKEVEGFRAYLAKGGFVIFDDFDGAWDSHNLEKQMDRVVPGGRFIELDGTHPIFHSFFEIDSPLDFVPPYGTEPPLFKGMFEDNDPTKRLIAIANYNNDIGEYWEFSDTGLVPIDLSNEAYKFGVNYIVYAMTH
jgi:hypothetical protein